VIKTFAAHNNGSGFLHTRGWGFLFPEKQNAPVYRHLQEERPELYRENVHFLRPLDV